MTAAADKPRGAWYWRRCRLCRRRFRQRAKASVGDCILHSVCARCREALRRGADWEFLRDASWRDPWSVAAKRVAAKKKDISADAGTAASAADNNKERETDNE